MIHVEKRPTGADAWAFAGYYPVTTPEIDIIKGIDADAVFYGYGTEDGNRYSYYENLKTDYEYRCTIGDSHD